MYYLLTYLVVVQFEGYGLQHVRKPRKMIWGFSPRRKYISNGPAINYFLFLRRLPLVRPYKSTLVSVLPSRIAPFSIILRSSDSFTSLNSICSSSSGCAAPALSPSARKTFIDSPRKPGLAKYSTSVRHFFAWYPVSSASSRFAPASAPSPASSLPAGSPHKYWFAACRYCRSITIHGFFLLFELSIARITTLPLCRITSRSLCRPPGSISLSCRMRNSGPWYTTSELMIVALSIFAAVFGALPFLIFFAFTFVFFGISSPLFQSRLIAFNSPRVYALPCFNPAHSVQFGRAIRPIPASPRSVVASLRGAQNPNYAPAGDHPSIPTRKERLNP